MNAVVSLGSFENLVSVAGVTPTDVTAGAAAVSLATLNAKTRRVTVFFTDQETRYTLDGSTPSATHGALGVPGGNLTMSRAQAQKFKAIRAGGTNATLYVVEQEFANGARG